MTDKECNGCKYQHGCAEAYHRLGRVQGANMTPMVLMAFVLPLLMLILCLWGMSCLLGDHPGPLMTLVSLLVALGTSFLVILCCWLIRRKGRHDNR